LRISLADLANERVILVLGGPRSGTTWLAKIFDSHPDVLYRHEPDTVNRDQVLQDVFTDDQIGPNREAARDYLRQLLGVQTLKTAGSLPLFRKNYYGLVRQLLHDSTVYALRVVEKVGVASGAAKHLPVPDMLDAARHPALKVVIKSVSSRGRVRLFAEAMPGARIIFIVRDPCGQIASMMRGAALGKFADPAMDEVIRTEQARRYGLTAARLEAMSPVERFAWHWAVLNEKAIADLAELGTGKVVRYQELCVDPVGVSKGLFAFTGLGWHPQTERFIATSTSFNGPDRYYQVSKTSGTSLNKWRSELAREDQRRILQVVRETSMWGLCPEYESVPEPALRVAHSPPPTGSG
jgi:Sulfotransferase family